MGVRGANSLRVSWIDDDMAMRVASRDARNHCFGIWSGTISLSRAATVFHGIFAIQRRSDDISGGSTSKSVYTMHLKKTQVEGGEPVKSNAYRSLSRTYLNQAISQGMQLSINYLLPKDRFRACDRKAFPPHD